MDRFTHIDQEFVDQQRIERDSIEDPRDYANRPVVAYYQSPTTGEWYPSKLRRDDDIKVSGGIRARVVGPASGRNMFAAVYNEEWGQSLGVFALDQVEDRAPFDASEPAPHYPLIPVSA